MEKKSFAFKKGFGLVKGKDQPIVKKEIMQMLCITSRPAWLARLNGTTEPKVSEAQAIEHVFEKYGITEPWGDESECELNKA